MMWWYLSFAGMHGFRGGCYVEALPEDLPVELMPTDPQDLPFLLAVRQANRLGISPGGQVRGCGPFSEDQLPPKQYRNRLLDKDTIMKELDGMKWPAGEAN